MNKIIVLIFCISFISLIGCSNSNLTDEEPDLIEEIDEINDNQTRSLSLVVPKGYKNTSKGGYEAYISDQSFGEGYFTNKIFLDLRDLYWNGNTDYGSLNDCISSIEIPGVSSGFKWYVAYSKDVKLGGTCSYATGGTNATSFNLSSTYNDKVSSIQCIRAKSLNNIIYKGIFPGDGSSNGGAENRYSEEAQGIASDGGNWYISDKWHVSRIPMSSSLLSPPSKANCRVVELSSVGENSTGELISDHIGDIDAYGGKLYVPFEKIRCFIFCGMVTPILPDGRRGTPVLVTEYSETANVGVIGIYNANETYSGTNKLKCIKMAALSGSYRCPWVAYNPQTGLMYSTQQIDVNTINVYDPNFTYPDPNTYPLNSIFPDVHRHTIPIISPLYTITLDKQVPRTQGACWGDDGLLYISSDGTDSASPDIEDGIYVFRVVGKSGTFLKFIHPGLSYEGNKETEGIDYFDTSTYSGDIPGFDNSDSCGMTNLHMMILDLDNVGDSGADQDDINIEHYRVTY